MIFQKVAADGTVDTIAEAVGTELTTDIKEEIEGKVSSLFRFCDWQQKIHNFHRCPG